MTDGGRNRGSGIGCSGIVIVLALYVALFLWYCNTVVPHTYPTEYTNFFWGMAHGFYMFPTLVWSAFADTVTIYQSPNDGGWYNFGYFIGAGALVAATKKM